jgi:threonine dehydrogenase-like Zn-dependent dehydrogenase
MRAVTWQGKRDVRVEDVPDPKIEQPTDAIVLPTAWQAVAYADVPMHQGIEQVIGVDLVPERLTRAQQRGVQTVDLNEHSDDLGGCIRDMTNGRGPDSVVDAVGLEAHGSPVTTALQKLTGLLPTAIAEPLLKQAGADRLSALYSAIDLVRRGGTISLSGVYGGAADPIPMMQMFDKQVQLRMGQANVKRWVDDIMPLLSDDDPLDVESFASHTLPLEQAPDAYAKFQAKEHGYFKVLLKP